jgi:SAM-dependent methyltransferase
MGQRSTSQNTEAPDSKSGFLRSIFQRGIGKASRVLRRLKEAVAFGARKTIPLLERVTPTLARRMRAKGWIWQPTFGYRNLNELYDAAVDPYNFTANPYEAGKYAHTMQLLSGRTYDAALEIGAAEGVFTEMLAPVCRFLVAIDIAEAAVARGRQRLAQFSNVKFIQAALPHQMPDGYFDLMIASDVLNYFPKDVLIDVLHLLAERLVPGGMLFALHYRGSRYDWPIDPVEVHELLKTFSQLELIHNEVVEGVGPAGDGYIVTILKKGA